MLGWRVADTTERRASGAGIVLLTLAAGQFLMTLDSSVMNVSIATVAKDVGTTVTGIQTAITLYTLVMASLMITGGKIGQILGRKRAFAIGCVIYGCGSFITAISPSLGVLIFGWSFLEGIGAALILPAIVALVASNFRAPERPRAYGLVASAGAIAVAAGPLIGGLFTTYLSWRWVFVGEVVIVLVILAAHPPDGRRRARGPECGSTWWARRCRRSGSALIVFGVLRAGAWGFVQPKPGAPEWLGLSPSIWLMLGGGLVVWLFLGWENRRIAHGQRAAGQPGDPAQRRRSAAGSPRSSSSTCCRRGCSSRCPCSCRSRLGSRRSRRASDCCRCRSRCCWRRRASRRCFPTRRRVGSSSWASSRCSRASSSWSARSTLARGPTS